MRQVVFIKQNENRWKEVEAFTKGFKKLDADTLAHFYITTVDDLSYARTFYPDSNLVPYLNDLALSLHTVLYSNKRDEKNRLYTFWLEEVPLAIFRQRKKIWVAFVIFALSVGLGLLSAHIREDFPRIILGDFYINQTIENIERGDPMAVYGSSGRGQMFLGIGMNNIYVSFLAFTLGILGSVFTGMILFTNGVMVGAFIFFFVRYELFGLSFTTIMIHGTLELWAIIVAGAAGIVLGNAWLFPGTYSRSVSLLTQAKDALIIIVGLVPVFIIAALLESYVTRHYLNLTMGGRIMVMLLSVLYIYGYFFYLPNKVYANSRKTLKK